MANAALVIENHTLAGLVAASSQALAMPATNLLTPHPSERWRSLSPTAYFVLDKGSERVADTVFVKGLTAGRNATIRLRLSSTDSTGVAGDVFDSGPVANGSLNLDVDYYAAAWALPAPLSWQFTRVDIFDPDADFVEAGCLMDGLREAFNYNFTSGSGIQFVDRSRVATSAAGLSMVWPDNWYRKVDFSFEWVSAAQRYGLIERLDRINGRRMNVLLIVDVDSPNLARDSVFGLVTDLTPNTFAQAVEIFGKQLRIDERL
jgi:hypothetical protein